MGDVHGVQMLKRSRDLVDDFRSFALREGVFRSLLNPGEKLPAFHAFHHNQQDSRAIVDVFVNINNPERRVENTAGINAVPFYWDSWNSCSEKKKKTRSKK